MADIICRAVLHNTDMLEFLSAAAMGDSITKIIEDDKKYGKMEPLNGQYFTFKVYDWKGRWITKKQLIKGVGIAWEQVEKVINIKVKEAKGAEKPDFRIYFRGTDDDPLLTKDTIQYHYYPITNPDSPNRGVCVVNTDFKITIHGNGINMHEIDPEHYPEDTTAKGSDIDFDQVYQHELCHGLGLPHSPHKYKLTSPNYGIMAESIFDEIPEKLTGEGETILRLQAKYPKKNMILRKLKRWIAYFKVRRDKY